jgi:hypothetical protein
MHARPLPGLLAVGEEFISRIHCGDYLRERQLPEIPARVIADTHRDNMRVACRLGYRFLIGADNSVLGHRWYWLSFPRPGD